MSKIISIFKFNYNLYVSIKFEKIDKKKIKKKKNIE